ncbi:hypothetical protein AHF37_00467, partial [Paragonimus kellicotti]
PPTFTEKPEDVTVPVNGSVIFRCNASGIPAPQIRWTVNGQDPSTYVDGVRKILRGNIRWTVNGQDPSTYVDGVRKILRGNSVAITDSGVYECTATNPFGSRKASGRLLVRRRTSIVLAPIDTQVYENQVVKFVCTAETDPMELDNLRITWYKDDNLIMPEVTPRIQKVWFDYSLVLSGAQPRDTGQYRCNASNGLDYAGSFCCALGTR